MSLGANRRTVVGRELNGWGWYYTTVSANALAAATSLSIVGNGGTAYGAPTIKVGMKVFFLNSSETPKTITAITGPTSGNYTLTISGLTNAVSQGATVAVGYAPNTAILMDSFSSKREMNKWTPMPYTGTRAKNINLRTGRIKASGAMEFMLRPDVNDVVIARSIGYDSVVGTAAGVPSATTVNTASAVADTTLVLAAIGTIAVNDILQVGANPTAECRKVTNVTTNTVTFDAPLQYAHAVGEAVSRVQAPYTHTIPSGVNNLPSLSIEDYIPFDDDTQSSGITVLSYYLSGAMMKSLKIESQTENGIKVNIDYEAQDKVQAGAQTALAIPSEAPYTFAQEAVLFAGTRNFRITECSLEIDNDPQERYAKNGSNRRFTLKAGLQEVKGSFKFYEDVTTQQQFWQLLENDNPISFAWTITDPTTGYSFSITCPKIVVTDNNDGEFAPGDLINGNINFTAQLDAGGTNAQVGLVVVNSDYQNF